MKDDRLISLNAAIDRARMIPVARIVTEDKVIWRKAVFIEDIEALPTAQPRWIPVTERPIEGGQYIVTLKDDKEVWTDIAEWNPTFGGRWQAEFFDCEYCDIDNVVAWMPLPKPYREGGQDE